MIFCHWFEKKTVFVGKTIFAGTVFFHEKKVRSHPVAKTRQPRLSVLSLLSCSFQE